MYILYNRDGSISRTNFAEFVQKNNDEVNHIFVAIKDFPITEYNVYASFMLPNGQLGGPLIGEVGTQVIDQVTYAGYKIPITNEVTAYEGIVKMSIKVYNDNETLYTYLAKITVNDAASAPDETKINITQYEQLLNAINQGVADGETITVVDDIEETELAGFSTGHLFYSKADQQIYVKIVTSPYYQLYDFYPTLSEEETLEVLEGEE